MKKVVVLAVVSWFYLSVGYADTLVFQNGSTIEGTVVQTNIDEVLVLTESRTFNYGLKSIKEIRPSKVELAEAEAVPNGRVPDFRTTVLLLGRQAWSKNLMQIPATVINEGVLKNVPYVSFRCGDYEANVYGDLVDPAGIEIGIYRGLLTNEQAKRNCINFIADLLRNAEDKKVVLSLNFESDIRERSGYRFEITPSTAKDSYGGWWVSVYSQEKLDSSRASEKELAAISVSKSSPDAKEGAWSAEELKLARATPDTITFTNLQGDVISNATVVRVIDNAYLIWRKEASGGKVKLSGLPPDLQARFGHDAAKAAIAYAADEKKKKEVEDAYAKAVNAAQQMQTQAEGLEGYDSGYAGSYGGGGGSVYVRGYYRKNGTYVSPYTRRR